MNTLTNLAEVLIRSFTAIVFLYLLTKLMGTQQIAQLTFFDYVVGISIGSTAAQTAVDRQLPYYEGFVSMAVFALVAICMSVLTTKSLKARNLLTGKPIIVIEKGVIIEKNLRKIKYDVNDLMTQLRINGYFEIADVYYAIMETNGCISVLPRASKRPATTEDMSVYPSQKGLTANLILDGRIIDENLNSVNRDRAWLEKQLNEQKVFSPDKVLLATCDTDYTVRIYLKNELPVENNLFD